MSKLEKFVEGFAAPVRPAVAPSRSVEPIGFNRELELPRFELEEASAPPARAIKRRPNWTMLVLGLAFALWGALVVFIAQPMVVWAVFALALMPGVGFAFLAAGLMGISRTQLFG